MTATEENNSYNKQIRINRYIPPPESTCHKFMVVLTYYTVLKVIVWVKQCYHYKILCK